MSDGPTIRKGKSKQDYATPDDFLNAVRGRFGEIVVDLAADKENAICPLRYFDETTNSLNMDWGKCFDGNLWLNPPYNDILPWVKKCTETDLGPDKRILVLVPASVGSGWYRLFVERQAYVLALNPRLTFKGCTTPYPKDCILAVYGQGLTGFKTWRWK